MTRWLGFLVILLLLTFAKRTFLVSAHDSRLQVTVDRASLSGAPFSGWIYAFHQSNRPASLIPFWQGLKQGRERHWYANGQSWFERDYNRGVPDGLERGWHANGEVRVYQTFIDGQLHGEAWAWHNNGQLSNFTLFNKGTAIAVKSWSSFGAIHYNYLFRDNDRVGVQGGKYCQVKSSGS